MAIAMMCMCIYSFSFDYYYHHCYYFYSARLASHNHRFDSISVNSHRAQWLPNNNNNHIHLIESRINRSGRKLSIHLIYSYYYYSGVKIKRQHLLSNNFSPYIFHYSSTAQILCAVCRCSTNSR